MLLLLYLGMNTECTTWLKTILILNMLMVLIDLIVVY